jgi:hypothetical protein
MSDPTVARKIDTTGWTTVLLGGLCLFVAGVQATAPRLLARLSEGLETVDDPMRGAREAWLAGAGQGAWLNGAFGAGLLVVGFAVARRLRWGHAALTAAGWVSIAGIVALTKPTLAPLLAMAGVSTGARAITWGVTVLLVVAQIAALVWFLRFWRRPDVRRAFDEGRSGS